MIKGFDWLGHAISRVWGPPRSEGLPSAPPEPPRPGTPVSRPADPPFEPRVSAGLPSQGGHVPLATGVYGGEPSLFDRATLANVFQPSWDAPIAPQLAGWELVPPSDETRGLLERLSAEAQEALGPAHIARIMADLDEQAEGVPPDPELARARRARAFVEARVDVFRSPDGAQLAVCEKVLPWPDGVARPPEDPEAGLALLEDARVVVEGPLAGETRSLLRFAAEVLPADALELLAQSLLKVEAHSPGQRSRYLLEVLGPAHDFVVKSPPAQIRDRYVRAPRYEASQNHVSLHEWTGSPAMLRTQVVEGLAHALDRLLGTGGERLSDSPEWKAVASEHVPLTTWIPAFLGVHLDIEGVPRTRADLQRMEPRAHDFILDLFARRVPNALRETSFQSAPLDTQRAERTRDEAQARAEALERVEPKDRDPRAIGMAWFTAAYAAVTYAKGRPSVESLRRAAMLTKTAVARMGEAELLHSYDGKRLFEAVSELEGLQRPFRFVKPPTA